MRQKSLRTLCAAGALCVLTVGVAGSSDEKKEEKAGPAGQKLENAQQPLPPVPVGGIVKPLGGVVKVEKAAKAVKPPKKDDGGIVVADWLDIAGVLNKLFNIRSAPARSNAASLPLELKAAVPAAKATKPRAKNDGRIAIADWLDVGANVAEAFNEVLGVVPAPRAAGAAVPAPVNAALTEADFQVFEKQYGKRFWMLYKGELHFLRLVCQPTRQQFDLIAAAGEPDVTAAMRRCAPVWNEQRRGIWRADADRPDVRKLITTGLAKAVKANLSPDQADRYQKELGPRDAAHRRVVALNLLARMDRRLVLSGEQQAKLQAILEQNWATAGNQTQMLQQGDWYFPVMPDEKILPVLTDAQKTVWRGVYKGRVAFGLELDQVQQISLPHEEWPEEGGKK
jgi:hypothetical protein